MKPKILTSILLFISAYAPFFVILAIKDFDFDRKRCFNHSTPIFILLGITLVSVVLLFYSIKSINRGNMPVKVKAIKSRSIDLINYTIPYIVSFFGFDLSKTADIISLSIFLLLMLLMTIKSKSVFMNPILLLAGYNLYDLDYEFDSKTNSTIVISNYDMRIGETYYIRSLTRFLYFVTKKENQT